MSFEAQESSNEHGRKEGREVNRVCSETSLFSLRARSTGFTGDDPSHTMYRFNHQAQCSAFTLLYLAPQL